MGDGEGCLKGEGGRRKAVSMGEAPIEVDERNRGEGEAVWEGGGFHRLGWAFVLGISQNLSFINAYARFFTASVRFIIITNLACSSSCDFLYTLFNDR